MTESRYWERAHVRRDMDLLTGSSPLGVFRLYDVSVPSQKRVADIGIGTGAMSRFLTSLGNEVVSVDIAPSALDKAAGRAILTNYLLEEEPFDLAIAHLVVQHTPPEELGTLFGVPLKPGGSMWFQFSTCDTPKDHHFWYTTDEIAAFGAEVKHLLDFPDEGIRWWRGHIRG